MYFLPELIMLQLSVYALVILHSPFGSVLVVKGKTKGGEGCGGEGCSGEGCSGGGVQCAVGWKVRAHKFLAPKEGDL